MNYFVYDIQRGFTIYKTEDEALEDAKRLIDFYFEEETDHGGWPDTVNSIRVGQLTHMSQAQGDRFCGYDFNMEKV